MQNHYRTHVAINPWPFIKEALENMQVPAPSAMFSAHEHSKQELHTRLADFEKKSFQIHHEVLGAVAGLKALKEHSKVKLMSNIDLIKYMRTRGMRDAK